MESNWSNKIPPRTKTPREEYCPRPTPPITYERRRLSLMLTTTTFYCVFSLFHLSSGAPEQENIVDDARVCPIGCQCTLAHVPDIFQSSTRSPVTRASCNGVRIPRLRDLARSLPPSLESLTLKNNGLMNMMDLCCLPSLKYLDTSFNNLTSIVTYSPFVNLTYLNVQNNDLKFLRQGAFTSFPNLEILNLDNNKIGRINDEPFRLFRLKELYLSRNQISYISERIFRYTPELQILNLSGNKLVSIHNRNFYFSPNLHSLDVSYNQIVKVDDYAFDHLPKLRVINLAYNNLLEVPSKSFRALPNLKTLNLDGNPIKLLRDDSFWNLSVEEVRMSQSGRLIMVLSGAFRNLAQLRSVYLGGNENFLYISPNAFQSTPGLQSLHLEDSNLRLIPQQVLSASSKLQSIDLMGNPLDCGCMNRLLQGYDRRNLLANKDDTYCWSGERRHTISSESGRLTQCTPQVHLMEPDKESLVVSLGAKFQLFCVVSSASNDLPFWILPGGKKVADSRSGRISQSAEFLDFKFVLESDSGLYICSTKNSESQKKILLSIQKPDVAVYPVEISPYYVTLGWNQTLEPKSEKGEFALDLQELDNPDNFHSTILPHSMLWRSYTLTELKAETNYSVCLVFQYDNLTLYRRCVDLQTPRAQIGMARTLNYSLLALVVSCATFVCAVCFARCVHRRFHIWQEEKYRSRMAESISGQSFLSSVDSLAHGGEVAVTYENIHMSSSLYSSVSSGSNTGRSSCRSSSRRQRVHKEDCSSITRDLAL